MVTVGASGRDKHLPGAMEASDELQRGVVRLRRITETTKAPKGKIEAEVEDLRWESDEIHAVLRENNAELQREVVRLRRIAETSNALRDKLEAEVEDLRQESDEIHAALRENNAELRRANEKLSGQLDIVKSAFSENSV